MTPERLKKIRELALNGVDGEKEAAQAALEKLSVKYGISIETLDEEIPHKFHFEFHGEEERRLLSQVAFKVIGETGHSFPLNYTDTGRRCKTKISIECTEAQRAEIEFYFDFYNRLWKKEKEYLYKAFINKHYIFGETAICSSETDYEERKKITAMMAGLSDEKPLLQLEDKL